MRWGCRELEFGTHEAINELYVDGEQYEELRQSIEERWLSFHLISSHFAAVVDPKSFHKSGHGAFGLACWAVRGCEDPTSSS